MKKTKAVATCGLLTALSVVLMLIGHIIDIGLYAAPMLAGLCLLPVGRNYGVRYQITVWLAISVLSFILVPNIEENLTFLLIFGLYPILRDRFSRLGKVIGTLVKFLYFNVIFTAIEMLMLFVIAPEAIDLPLMLLLLACGNLMFIAYDFILPKMEYLLNRYLGKLMKK